MAVIRILKDQSNIWICSNKYDGCFHTRGTPRTILYEVEMEKYSFTIYTTSRRVSHKFDSIKADKTYDLKKSVCVYALMYWHLQEKAENDQSLETSTMCYALGPVATFQIGTVSNYAEPMSALANDFG